VPMLKEIGGAVAFDASGVTAWLCVPPDPRKAELVFRSAMRAAIKRAVGACPPALGTHLRRSGCTVTARSFAGFIQE
jgi:hypothetical protein